jgi:hypothetical protein
MVGLLLLSGCSDGGISTSNRAPSVLILAPVADAQLAWGVDVAFCAVIEDPDRTHGPEDLRVLLTSGLDGVLWDSESDPGAVGTSCDGGLEGNLALNLTGLAEGGHTLSLSAWDPFGAAAEDTVVLEIARPPNTAPTCELLEPGSGAGWFEGEPPTAVAQVVDGEDAFDQIAREWASTLDGPLGPGEAGDSGLVSLDLEGLSAGAHFLSLSLTDGRGAVGACGVPVTVTACVDSDGDGVTNCDGDCDDHDASVFPGAEELPDGLDNDCNGVADDGTVLTDDDGDGMAEFEGDCDDDDPTVYQGAAEDGGTGTGEPTGIDNNCNGTVDEGTTGFDDDGDGFCEGTSPLGCTDGTTAGDCDDGAYTVNPARTEVACDSVDQDCDGLSDDAPDEDADGYDLCDPADPGDTDGLPADCVDTNAGIHPGGLEVLCDGLDQDCDGLSDDAPDADADSYDVCAAAQPGDTDGLPADCDDADPTVAPGMAELPDALDQDCDGLVDEGTDAYDDDGDGYCEGAAIGCTDGSTVGDCDDLNPLAFPGAVELPNSVDDDCDGTIDNGTVLYDDDGDGFTEAALDCDDSDASVYPGAPETADGVDEDCDGLIDEGTDAYDDDLDGYSENAGDCDDTDAAISPGATEVTCDGVDQDCSGSSNESPDVDADGWDACDPTDVFDGDGLPEDCATLDPAVNPGAVEIVCDGIDQDCDGFEDDAPDVDGDGFDICLSADAGDLDGFPPDCDDTDIDIWPGALELIDGIDQDCDGIADEGTTAYDDDGDGFCESACTDGSSPGDCDDSNSVVYPNAPEVIDGLDNDCDGLIDDGTSVADDDGDGFAEVAGDCDDTDPLVYPAAPEDGGAGDDLGDGIDNDCDGFIDEGTLSYDDDLDGWCEVACTDGSLAGDCDDTSFLVNPGQDEQCADGIDNDCDGTIDLPDNDDDGFVDGLCGGDDCDDLDPTVFPGAVELFDTADNDCDGDYDEGFVLPGMIVVSEVMKNPSAVGDAAGEYFEVFNPGADAINLHGWVVSDEDGNSFTIDEDVIVESGGYAVLGTLDDYAANGGYYPDYTYPYSAIGGMQLGNGADEIVLTHVASEIDRIEYATSGWPNPSGHSMELINTALDASSNDLGSNWCTSTTTLPAGDEGTPGAPNSC